MSKLQGEAILFEMLRSFSTLARTLNLSKAVRELGTTRQTLRRHIGILEENMGNQLFRIVDRQYELTEAGGNILPEALELLARGEALLLNRSGQLNGMAFLTYEDDPQFTYYGQQQPISALWDTEPSLVKRGFQAWSTAEGHLEDPAFTDIRPYWMVFRWHDEHWICTEVGNKSSYASWMGWEYERSAVGRDLLNMPGGGGFGRMTMLPFDEVRHTHGVRLDHIHTQMNRPYIGEFVPISYRRLIMGCRYPDGSFALANIVERTHNLTINALSDEQIQAMPEELIMNI